MAPTSNELETTSNEPAQVSKDDGPKKETVGEALERMREKPMTRGDILQKAIQVVCHNREDQYGTPEESFELIAQIWQALGDKEPLSAKDVAVRMIVVKLARASTGQPHADNWVDIAGYAALAGELESKEVEDV